MEGELEGRLSSLEARLEALINERLPGYGSDEVRLSAIESQLDELRSMQFALSEQDNGFLHEEYTPLPPSAAGGGLLSGCYEISAKDEEKGLASGDFVNCHIICSGLCVQGPTGNAWLFPNKIVAIRLTRNYDGNSLWGYDSFAEIRDDQVNNDVTVYPLYKIGDVTTSESGEVSGTVEIDYRNIPHFDTWAAIP